MSFLLLFYCIEEKIEEGKAQKVEKKRKK